MQGTNVYGVLFWVAALILGVFLVWSLIEIWRRFVKKAEAAWKGEQFHTSAVAPVIKSFLLIGCYVALVTIGWNLVQGATTTMSSYKNPAEVTDQKAVAGSQLPSKEDMDKTRADLKTRAEDKPHEKALDDFDASMKKEADKIKERSIDPQPANSQK